MASVDDAYDNGPRTWQEAFPPICLRTHYNPCAMSSYILPPAGRPAPTYDPRPAVRICTTYKSTSRGDAPQPPQPETAPPKIPSAFCGAQLTESIDFPPGGAARLGFPYATYMAAVNTESSLMRKTEPLTKCSEKRYIPNKIVNEPRSAIVGISGNYAAYEAPANPSMCAQQDLDAAAARSSRQFMNHTRYDRTRL